jgi:integrase/recombinase XerD
LTEADRALVDRFLDMMAAEAGAARNTLLAYRRDLEAGATALGEVSSAQVVAIKRLG